MGVTLGFGTAMLGEKAAMLCTASVEEVIDEHYKNQTFKLKDDEKELKKKIEKFRADEIEHKNIAYDSGATKKGPYGLLDKIIKTSSRIAITISEKNLIKVLTLYPSIDNPSNFHEESWEEKFLPFLCKSSTVGIKGLLNSFIPLFSNSFPPFLTLHVEQAVTTFSQSVTPPFDFGSK